MVQRPAPTTQQRANHHDRRSALLVAGILACALLALAPPASAEVTLAAASDRSSSLSVNGSEAVRYEAWRWFEAGPEFSNEYGYGFSRTRLGASLKHESFLLRIEGQLTQWANLPGDAVAPAPRGALGVGANYFQHAGERSPTGLLLKYAYLEATGDPLPDGLTLRTGRFDYLDGLETLSGQATIDWLKRARGSERLIGPFGWSASQRSFDGGQVTLDCKSWNLTAMVAHPTQGGFEEDAGEAMESLGIGAAALTLKPGTLAEVLDSRLFVTRYSDRRSVTQRADNVTTTARRADIGINTYGLQFAGVVPCGSGEWDGLLWIAGQHGQWYELDHRAWGVALETGHRWKGSPWQPWLRAGLWHGSGDEVATDGEHGTFFQMLPTARKYARTPLYNLMNTTDVFVQAIVKPSPALVARADWHFVRLSDAADRWYAGSGATQESGAIFGYVQRPSNGERDLGHLLDVELTYKPTPFLTATLYYGHFIGGEVIERIYSGEHADLAYLEVEVAF